MGVATPFIWTVTEFAAAFALGNVDRCGAAMATAPRRASDNGSGCHRCRRIFRSWPRLASADGATRIVAYVVSGIGFLGAGVILKDGTSIRGLNTASTLWCSGSVGAFCGCGVSAEATALAAFILAGNTLLRPLVNYINRRPISEHVTEAQYIVHALCDPEDVSDVRDILFSNLEVAHYPIGDIQTLSESDEVVELAAAFIPTNAKPFELDLVVAKLEKDAVIKSATWTVATTS